MKYKIRPQRYGSYYYADTLDEVHDADRSAVAILHAARDEFNYACIEGVGYCVLSVDDDYIFYVLE